VMVLVSLNSKKLKAKFEMKLNRKSERTFKLKDNFDRSRLGVTIFDGFGGESSGLFTVTFGKFDN